MYSRRETQAGVLAIILLISCAQSARPPYRTVADYNQAIDNDPTVRTVQVSTLTNLNDNNPVLDYSYRTAPNGINIPVRVRALVRPIHINPIKRKGTGYSKDAEKKCKAMNKNRNAPNGNNDECGHMIPYILKGPGDWYNVVPQTRRINTGTVQSDLNAPSIWAATERVIVDHVKNGGSVSWTVTITYDLATSLRPTGFGAIETYKDANGAVTRTIPGYWYNNDPLDDPDSWNN